MNTMVKPPVVPSVITQFPVNINDPFTQLLLTQIDELLSCDINTNDIEELRLNARLALMHAHHDFLRCKAILKFMHGTFKYHRSEQLKKYLASDKSDQLAAGKALAFNRIVRLIPRNIKSNLEVHGR